MGHQHMPSSSKCPISPLSYHSAEASTIKKAHSLCSPLPNPPSTGGNTNFPPCAVCLGPHQHLIIEYKAMCTWDGAHDTITEHINKGLFTKDGCSICGRWQRDNGCPKKHDNKHLLPLCAEALQCEHHINPRCGDVNSCWQAS
ncbi:hypothetical protein PAXRUDRAFT_176853 [Paxillus rubicundulus Ve08.2h10]|uniref:Uncharacterized protein n=1 Tax=Paxillus rubicundulus Ve08.2h10 TaxID=930991 RepID=A0A0D0CSV7_9AGAM|nr:hypothetical protein PAXRUDRAFT_176853 [Paxillus rubicundulus Ve08.2h10]